MSAHPVPLRLPDFLIVGAMKCATSTLHRQLAKQPGLTMSDPKEIHFFSRDDQYQRGPAWYASHFAATPSSHRCGESSTTYTMLPDFPHVVDRISQVIPNAKFVYVMRHPVDRLLSHFVHDVTQRKIPRETEIMAAVDQYPRLWQYGQYAMQLKPFIDRFGFSRILPVFFERLTGSPHQELTRISQFLGVDGPLQCSPETTHENVSTERMMDSPFSHLVCAGGWMRSLRRILLPKALRLALRRRLLANIEKPVLTPAMATELASYFDDDLQQLGQWLGIIMDCASYRNVASGAPRDWKENQTCHA